MAGDAKIAEAPINSTSTTFTHAASMVTTLVTT
jgi:hypothetical protein